MSDEREEAQFRQHLAEMRRAAGGIGRDFASEFSDLDRKIERLGHVTAKEGKYLILDIQDDFRNLGRAMDEQVRSIPGHIANGGIAIGSAASRAGAATRDAVVSAGHRAKEGTRNALASAAGVKRTPMKEWSSPTTSSDEPP
ncbi:MAG TPA: hypothetical protein VMF04_02955 [Thermoplasmata archaeon]|nr:hypothetical protein [Thermoplasmata archaeon]